MIDNVIDNCNPQYGFESGEVLYQINNSAPGSAESIKVVVLGFEPRQAEPKPAVLPLHHTTIIVTAVGLSKRVQSYTFFMRYATSRLI